MSQFGGATKSAMVFGWKSGEERASRGRDVRFEPGEGNSFVPDAKVEFHKDVAIQLANRSFESTVAALTWGGTDAYHIWEGGDRLMVKLRELVGRGESKHSYDGSEFLGHSLKLWRVDRGRMAAEQAAVDGVTTVLGHALRLMSEADEQRLSIRVLSEEDLDLGATLSALFRGSRAGIASKTFGAMLVATLAERDAEQAQDLFLHLFPQGDSTTMSALARAAMQAEMAGVESAIEDALQRDDLPAWLRDDLMDLLDDIRE